MNDWKTIAKKMYRHHQAYRKIAERVGKSEEEVRLYLKSEREKEKTKTKTKPDKFTVFENLVPTTHIREWGGNQILSFGLIGDTHINSKYTQLTYLQKFYEICSQRGVKDIYHAGDIDEGEQMRTGHQYECYTQGADDHINEIVTNYPRIDGITTHFITGNHDSSIYKRCGVDIGEIISMKRKDMKYLGRDCAIIEITPNCILELRHPWDGTAYALSYKPQKMIEAMEADSKPNILAIGHYHKLEYLFYRNVHCFQAGCFQTQTPFTRGKGISVHLGGWIITIEVDKRGYIQRIVPEMIPFYKGIDSDYKNWSRSPND
jgi:predicted phosphodiesterase